MCKLYHNRVGRKNCLLDSMRLEYKLVLLKLVPTNPFRIDLELSSPLHSLQEAEEKTTHYVQINPEKERKPVSGDRNCGDNRGEHPGK